MVSFPQSRYCGDEADSHLTGHFLRVLRLPARLVHAPGLQAQVLDMENAFGRIFSWINKYDVRV